MSAASTFDQHNSALAAPAGDKIFTINCSGCHAGGKNMIDPKKPIFGSQKLANIKVFKELLEKAQGAMPDFEKIAKNDEALKALYAYVKELK